MITDEHAERLAEVACQMATRVRDEPPEDNRRWLHAALPDPADREALLYVLAAAVPDDRPWTHLTAWAAQRMPSTAGPRLVEADPETGPGTRPRKESTRQLRPHGTRAAANRHRYHKEPLCDLCAEADRVRERVRKREARNRAKQQNSVTERTAA